MEQLGDRFGGPNKLLSEDGQCLEWGPWTNGEFWRPDELVDKQYAAGLNFD